VSEEKRTLIETYLPVDEISEEAKKEKNGRAPTFEMHYWWTRKPLITARAAVLGALLPADFDPQEFKKLLGLEHLNVTGKRAHNYDIPLDRIQYFTNWIEKSFSFIPISKYFSVKCLKS
jgi:putative DNA methylase